MIAVGYDRVSTVRQAEQGVMLDARDDSIRRYCSFKGWELLGDSIFSDPGRSGREGKRRPGFEAAMKAACQPGRVLVVDALSRAFRSLVDADNSLKRLQAAGADIVIINLGVDTTTASGKLIFRIIAAVAEFESDQTGERVKAANRHIVKTLGFRTMGEKRFGWEFDAETRTIVEVPKEQAVIRTVLDLAAENGRSRAEMADVLNSQGARTPSGLEWNARNLGAFLRKHQEKQ